MIKKMTFSIGLLVATSSVHAGVMDYLSSSWDCWKLRKSAEMDADEILDADYSDDNVPEEKQKPFFEEFVKKAMALSEKNCSLSTDIDAAWGEAAEILNQWDETHS